MCVGCYCAQYHIRTTKRHTQVSHAIFPLASISKKSTIIDLIFDLVSRTTPQGEFGNHIVSVAATKSST